MHILMIAPQPFFTPRGTPLSVYYRLLTLSELGHRVDLLTYPAGSDISLEGLAIRRAPAIPFIRNIPVGPSAAKLLLDMVLFPMALLRAACAPRRYHCLFVHEEAVAAGLAIKKLLGIPLVYDMHSSLPDQFDAFDRGGSTAAKLVFRRLEKAALAGADCVLTICPDLERKARDRGCDRTVLLPNSRLDQLPAAAPKDAAAGSDHAFEGASAFMTRRGDGDALFFYSGTLEAYQGIDLMLHAFAIVAAAKNNARLVVVGGAPSQVRALRSGFSELCRDDRLLFTGPLSPSQSDELMKRADVLLSTRTRGTNTPLKLYAFMASGIPMVLTDVYSHTQEVGPDQAFLAEPSAKALAEAMATSVEKKDLALRKARNARDLYESKYSVRRYRQQLAQALSLVNGQDRDHTLHRRRLSF